MLTVFAGADPRFLPDTLLALALPSVLPMAGLGL